MNRTLPFIPKHVRRGSTTLVAAAIALAPSPRAGTCGLEVDLLRDAFQGIAFGDSVEAVVSKLDGACDELKRIDVERPYLPLARHAQTHLVALGVSSVGVEEAAFTFADDALVLVELRGGAVSSLAPALEEEPIAFEGYELRPDAGIVTHREKDALWISSAQALHPNLYLWENPDLPSVNGNVVPYERSAERPPFLEFGAKLESLLPRMEDACASVWREDITPPWLPTEPGLQVQVNSLGFVFAGFPRKIEAVFGDGELQLAWILTGKGEEERVRRALIEAFGAPVNVNEQWEAFDGWRVALRKDKPEVLLLADRLVPLYREELGWSED